MLRRIAAALICLSVGALAGTPAQAGKRVALVIGNSAYGNAPKLPNPTRDAGDIAGSFERLGFAVTKKLDATGADMRSALTTFSRDAAGAEMAAIFFAGHGMEIGGENWLIPVDAELLSDTDAENQAISLRNAITQVSRAGTLGMVILDACRNNPFANSMQRTFRTRAVERGLARVEPDADNILVAYAAKEGTTAADGDGRNSPFTAALLKELETPGLEVRFLFSNVRDDVIKATNSAQRPYVYASLPGSQIFLKAASGAPVRAEAPPREGPSVELSTVASSLRGGRSDIELTSGPPFDDMRNRLFEQNFDPGLRGSKETQKAIESYQRNAGLTVDGRATEAVLDSLKQAPALGPWGAITFGPKGRFWGISWASPTRREAVNVAIARCGGSDKCPSQMAFFGANCGALAVSTTNWNMAWKVGGDASRKAALADCGRKGGACRIVGSVCADGSQKTN